MSVIFPNGYVLDTIRPFFGNENDAKITETILTKIGDLSTSFQENDIFIVYRGLRDVIDLLNSSGYEPRNFSLDNLNMKLLLSMMTGDIQRHVVWLESYHGRLKNWRMFKEQLSSNCFISAIGELFQVVTVTEWYIIIF